MTSQLDIYSYLIRWTLTYWNVFIKNVQGSTLMCSGSSTVPRSWSRTTLKNGNKMDMTNKILQGAESEYRLEWVHCAVTVHYQTVCIYLVCMCSVSRCGVLCWSTLLEAISLTECRVFSVSSCSRHQSSSSRVSMASCWWGSSVSDQHSKALWEGCDSWRAFKYC